MMAAAVAGRGRAWGALKPDGGAWSAAAAAAAASTAGSAPAGRDLGNRARRAGRYGVRLGAGRGVYDLRNTCNDKTGGEWRAFSDSVVLSSGGWQDSRLHGLREHPDRFPDGLARTIVKFFTKRGGTVLDPFAGTGSTLVACDEAGRRGIGVELYERWATVARERTRQTVVCADALDAADVVRGSGLDRVDLVLAGMPRPYVACDVKWPNNMRGHADPSDLSRAGLYGRYLDEAAWRIAGACSVLRRGGHLVAVARNEWPGGKGGGRDGACKPVAFDMVSRIVRFPHMRFLEEKLWIERRQKGGPVHGPPAALRGYPHRYVAGWDARHGTLHCMVFARA